MEYTKLPSFTSWWDDHADDYGLGNYNFAVTRILLPNKYPNFTFVTNEFRYSVRLPETFGKSLAAYSAYINDLIAKGNSGQDDVELIKLVVWVRSGKPKLDAMRKLRSEIDPTLFKPGQWAYLVNKELFYDCVYLNALSDSLTPSDEYTDSFASAFNLHGQSGAVSSDTPTRSRKASKPPIK